MTLEDARDELRKMSENLQSGPGNRRAKRPAPLAWFANLGKAIFGILTERDRQELEEYIEISSNH